MTPSTRRVLAACLVLVAAPLAGCLSGAGGPGAAWNADDDGEVREIRMWVKQTQQEIHPGKNTTVWAFCAEGDGVEPVRGDDCDVPGPTIRVDAGDRVKLTFENTHNVPHTVHFHGWHEFEADMNGVEAVDDAMVVQPGETETIEWTARPSGTFIYHCHFQTPTHMAMGMYGAFVVEDPTSPHPEPDVEAVKVLDEWSLGENTTFDGAHPEYDHFTMNGKSFPLTDPVVADPGDRVRIHMVNAGQRFRAMHVHGYTPDSWEGVAGPEHAVPTDVRRVAPGQSVVLEFTADREGVWLFHDHVVPSVTAGADGTGFGAYPRGLLTFVAVGDEYAQRVQQLAPKLVEQVRAGSGDGHGGHDGGQSRDGNASAANVTEVPMEDYEYQPETLHVEPNTTVRWVNEDDVHHTVTFDDGSADSGKVEAGETWSRTFEEPGRYEYHCKPHAYQEDGDWKGMVGTVVVEG